MRLEELIPGWPSMTPIQQHEALHQFYGRVYGTLPRRPLLNIPFEVRDYALNSLVAGKEKP